VNQQTTNTTTLFSPSRNSGSFLKSIQAPTLVCAVLLGSAAAPVAADVLAQTPVIKVYSEENRPHYSANDASFRAAYPLRVFVQVGNSRRERGNRERSGRRRDTTHRDIAQIHQLEYLLPSYVIRTANAEQADLILKVRRTDYDLNFRVIDLDQKDKKYKKSRRFTGDRCGNFHKAYYTRVKEKGEAYATYNLSVRLNGIGRDREQFTLRSAKNFSYGTNLRASTNCGMRPTQHMPSNGVAKLFGKANDSYRHHIADDIRTRAANDLSQQIARRIKLQADYFYTDLAARLTYGTRSEEDHDHHSHSNDGRQQSNYRPRYDQHSSFSQLLWEFGR